MNSVVAFCRWSKWREFNSGER